MENTAAEPAYFTAINKAAEPDYHAVIVDASAPVPEYTAATDGAANNSRTLI
jgi:hypothetical protein